MTVTNRADIGIEVLEANGAQTGTMTSLAPNRLRRAKAAYTTRRASLAAAATLLTGELAPNSGDLVLARVECIGQHTGLQLAHGRRSTLFVGDEIVVCYGDRYAPDQFEARVPANLDPCHLVAAGGIAATVQVQHGKMKPATTIRPLGLLADAQSQRLNLAAWALPSTIARTGRPLTLAAVGSAMNAGKTTSAAYLIKGLTAAGYRVGAAKVTGTGAPGDVHLMADAGANPVLDFTDAGFASTYRIADQALDEILNRLTGHLGRAGVGVIVLEVADGLLQRETAALLSSPVFAGAVDGLLFAACDALGAHAGLHWLQQRRLPVLALSGTLSASPLAMLEAGKATGLPVLGLAELADPTVVEQLIAGLDATPTLSKAG